MSAQPPDGGNCGEDGGAANSSNGSASNRSVSSSSSSNNSQDSDDDSATVRRIEKKIRVAKVHERIERLMHGSDGVPFVDVETEMERVTSIAPPATAAAAEDEMELKAADLESDLYRAVKRQDYEEAARLKREVSQMHVDDCGAVLQVNSRFYRAFSRKDLDEMTDLWLSDGTSTCIHPSCKPLVGSRSVLGSWRRMFETSNRSFQRSWMEPHEIKLAVKGAATAIVTCDEHVYARRFVRGKKRQTELVNKLTATNIFRKVDGKWFLTYHHASWHPDSEPAKMALKGSSGGGNVVAAAGGVGKSRIVRPPRHGDDGDADEGVSSMDGILGMSGFGPILGGENDGGADQKPGGPKRIVLGMGLSDLLNNNIGEILGGGAGGAAGGPGGNNPIGGDSAIIRFNRVEDEDRDEDLDDDEEIEEELEIVMDDDGEDSDSSEEGSEAVSIIQQWAESSSTSGAGKSPSSANNKKKSSSNSISSSGSASGSAYEKDALRQSCIAALRKLCDQGSISPKQKRVLLTDIITCSAKGEFSMVEVAYELLHGEGEDIAAVEGADRDAIEEEFADQCRVFAQSLDESSTLPSSSAS